MNTSATNRKIRVLLTSLKNKTLVPRPEFQRRLVWTNKHKQEFIKTILMEFPFPEIYIAAGEVNPDTGEGIEMLVDGQQRVTTLFQYFSGSKDFRLGDLRPYSGLIESEKLKFLEYEVVVRDIGKKTIEEIKQVFLRINSTKYSLNAMEIHNARYDGKFKEIGEKVSNNLFFESHRVFNTLDIRRMGDLLFCLTVMATTMSSYFNRDEDIGDFLERYNDEFSEGEDLSLGFEKVFEFIASCNFEENSRIWKKADLFTALVELYWALVRDSRRLSSAEISKKMKKFYNSVEDTSSGKMSDVLAEKYYKAALQATNDKSNRISRGEVIRDVLLAPL